MNRDTDTCSYCGTRRGIRKDGRFTRHHRFTKYHADAGLCPGCHPRIGDWCATCNGSCLVGFSLAAAEPAGIGERVMSSPHRPGCHASGLPLNFNGPGLPSCGCKETDSRPVFGVSPAPYRGLVAVCAACGGVAHGTVALATITESPVDPETRIDRDLAFCRHCIAQLAAGLTVDAKVWEEDHL